MASSNNVLVINEERIQANEVDLIIKEWKTPVEECYNFFKDKTIMHLSEYIAKYDYEIKNRREEEGIIITCAVVNIPYQVRKFNDQQFVFWDLSDLKETQSRLFLTGEACEEYANEKEGIVIALVSPTMKEKDPQYYGSSMLEISKKEQIKVIGTLDGLDKCKGKTKKGLPCKMAVYIPLQGNYCKYHVKQDRKKKKKKKAETEDEKGEVQDITGTEEGATDNIAANEKKKAVQKKRAEKKEANKKKKDEGELKNDGCEIIQNEGDIPEGAEYFDVDSIIGMFSKKEVKDKKKKAELVNSRIKELDEYVRLHNPVTPFDEYVNKTADTLNTPTCENNKEAPKKSEDFIATQCPELLHLIQKTTKKEEKEKVKTEEDKEKEKQDNISIKERKKLRFEKFLSKLQEFYKSKDEESTKNLIKGLVYTTNNFNFELTDIENSNILDLCYKLMDHRSEEVAIAALKFKRRINKEYINYYRKRRRESNSINDKNDKTHCELASSSQKEPHKVDIKKSINDGN